ncbi:MAG: agmatine deiminase family protein [Acidobacteriaceae bacterium]|nr:agmatine deiminase family protein [Acidobacteriaceae bacterium]
MPILPSLTTFRMPAEWEPHDATWLAWPHYERDWPGKFEPIPWVYAEIIRYLSRAERVDLIVNGAVGEKQARKTLERANAFNENIRFHRWPTNRVWMRDSGCTFVIAVRPSASKLSSRAKPTDLLSSSHQLAAVTWKFNAWAKYSNYQRDEKIGASMARSTEAREVRPTFRKQPVVLEGGSIDSNGQGTLLTTEECLLSKTQQRNAAMRRADYEKLFSQHLGVQKVIWLGSGIAGDDTHGHVDDITRFVAPDTVVTAVETNPNDANYEPLRDNIRRLREASDQEDKPISIIELPMPAPVFFEGRRLPASYANFYIANGLVLVPVFNDPNDRVALDILADLFPDREVVGIYSGDLIWGFGAMHCMTQQQPRIALSS